MSMISIHAEALGAAVEIATAFAGSNNGAVNPATIVDVLEQSYRKISGLADEIKRENQSLS